MGHINLSSIARCLRSCLCIEISRTMESVLAIHVLIPGFVPKVQVELHNKLRAKVQVELHNKLRAKVQVEPHKVYRWSGGAPGISSTAK